MQQDELRSLLTAITADRVALIERHEAGARAVSHYDFNNAYQYVIAREETHLTWLRSALEEKRLNLERTVGEPDDERLREPELMVFLEHGVQRHHGEAAGRRRGIGGVERDVELGAGDREALERRLDPERGEQRGAVECFRRRVDAEWPDQFRDRIADLPPTREVDRARDVDLELLRRVLWYRGVG